MSMRVNRAALALLLTAGVLGAAGIAAPASAAAAKKPALPIAPAEIDRTVAKAMRTFDVPGIAVGIVKDGALVYAKGYGVRTQGQSATIDADTGFGIGSNTKAFTTAALAILVDEGKLAWDDKVIDILPDFRMSDPWVTREFTVRDMLTHRSGLGLGAGDLMFAPKTDFTRQEIVRAIRHLKPVSSFRSEFAYDNLLYAIAGEIVAVKSGQSWEDFVAARIFAPLGMRGCASAPSRADAATMATPHVAVDGKLQTVPLLDIAAVAPAGSIVCSVNGMARWMETQLAHGVIPPGVGAAPGARLFSADRSREMWTAQTPLPVSGKRAELTRTHLSAYALGWGVEDFDGYLRVSHNGGLPGMVTHVSLIPELNLGVVVLTNQQEGAAMTAIALQILEAYTGAPKRDWVGFAQTAVSARLAAIKAADAERAPPPATISLDAAALARYAGTWVDAWRGEATIEQTADGLTLTFSRTDGLTGPMLPVGHGLFIVRWKDRTIDADAYVRFAEDLSGKLTGFTMAAVSGTTDFSYDFHDLDFKRKPEAPAAH